MFSLSLCVCVCGAVCDLHCVARIFSAVCVVSVCTCDRVCVYVRCDLHICGSHTAAMRVCACGLVCLSS